MNGLQEGYPAASVSVYLISIIHAAWKMRGNGIPSSTLNLGFSVRKAYGKSTSLYPIYRFYKRDNEVNDIGIVLRGKRTILNRCSQLARTVMLKHTPHCTDDGWLRFFWWTMDLRASDHTHIFRTETLILGFQSPILHLQIIRSDIDDSFANRSWY